MVFKTTTIRPREDGDSYGDFVPSTKENLFRKFRRHLNQLFCGHGEVERIPHLPGIIYRCLACGKAGALSDFISW